MRQSLYSLAVLAMVTMTSSLMAETPQSSVGLQSLGIVSVGVKKGVYGIDYKKKTVDNLKKLIAEKRRKTDAYNEQLVAAFLAAEKKFGVPAVILQAIAFVESSYVLNAVNKQSNDYGLMQINVYNIKHYGFDKKRLLTDLHYSVNAGAQVFRWFYRRYNLDEAIGRYNCGTLPSCINKKSVVRYIKRVKKGMK